MIALVLAIFCFAVTLVTMTIGGYFGARVWATYCQHHRWHYTDHGPIPDLKDYVRALAWYASYEEDERVKGDREAW